MSAADDWRSPEQRKGFVLKIDSVMSRYGQPTMKRAAEIEEQIFANASGKEDYLQKVARLIRHIGGLRGGQTANNQDALPQHPTDLQNGQVEGARAMNVSNPLLVQPNVTITSSAQNRATSVQLGSLPGGFVQQHQTSLPNTSQATMYQVPSAVIPQADTTNKVTIQMQGTGLTQQQQQHILRQRQQQLQQHKTAKLPENYVVASSPQLSSVTSGNLTTQLSSNSHFSVPQPKGLQPSLQPLQQGSGGAMIKPSPSPLSYSEPSPSAPLPASSPLPTPGSAPSPLNPEDEEAYMIKIKELSKYIEPLKKIISQIPNTEEHKTNLDKMNGLLDTLTQKRRVHPSALEKSELILARLLSSSLQAPSSAPLTSTHASTHLPNTASASVPPFPGKGVVQQWSEILNTLAPDPRLPAAARQTIAHGLNLVNALTIGPPRPPIRKRKLPDDEETHKSKVPHALKVEIAYLWQRFHFSYQKSPDTDQGLVVLSCKSKNKALPSMPPLVMKIPPLYPKRQPEYVLHNYDSSPFLQNIKRGLKSKLLRMVNLQTFSSILHAWEESIHEACQQEDLFAFIEGDKS